MASKTRVLFVDDEPCVLSGLERVLFDLQDQWDMQFASSGKQAIAAFETQPFDVIVTDMRMPEMDGAELLVAIQQRWPASVRIILSGQAEKEAVLRSIGPSHRFLPKPCGRDVLYETISKACQLHQRLGSAELHELVARQIVLPCMPQLYDLLINEIQSPEPSPERVAELISQDVSISCKLLQIVNSALHGRPTRFSSTLDVVKAIGMDRLRPILLSAGIFSQFTEMPFAGEQAEQFVHHSATVSRLAQAIVEREMPGNTAAAGSALLGGLIHDVGKLVLAQNRRANYQSIIESAERACSSTCHFEREAYGCDHSAIGAYLLALWGIPDSIVEVVAHHHLPALSGDRRFSPTTAVHVANALDHAHRTGQPARLDVDYLERIGVAHKVPRWRKLMPTNQHSWFYPAMLEGSRASIDMTLSIGLV